MLAVGLAAYMVDVNVNDLIYVLDWLCIRIRICGGGSRAHNNMKESKWSDARPSWSFWLENEANKRQQLLSLLIRFPIRTKAKIHMNALFSNSDKPYKYVCEHTVDMPFAVCMDFFCSALDLVPSIQSHYHLSHICVFFFNSLRIEYIIKEIIVLFKYTLAFVHGSLARSNHIKTVAMKWRQKLKTEAAVAESHTMDLRCTFNGCSVKMKQRGRERPSELKKNYLNFMDSIGLARVHATR